MGTVIELDKFQGFGKIPRLVGRVVVTEKIDGTNAQVAVLEDGRVLAGSRNRWLTPENDNFGFAAWVALHHDELRDGLGVGRHFGEWYGSGIQRGYGFTNGERRFALFNIARWDDNDGSDVRPACCHVVPLLGYTYRGFGDVVDVPHEWLPKSMAAAPGWDGEPEGLMLYHERSGMYFKHPFDDGSPKGAR